MRGHATREWARKITARSAKFNKRTELKQLSTEASNLASATHSYRLLKVVMVLCLLSEFGRALHCDEASIKAMKSAHEVPLG
eukprot:6186191-Pleurochrysis_carterae.AAC.1